MIGKSRREALRAVNRALVQLYWNLGKRIVEEQEKEGWGRKVVEKLSLDLKESFPDMNGLSSANLWRIRQFYLYYRGLKDVNTDQKQILAAVLREFAKHL